MEISSRHVETIRQSLNKLGVSCELENGRLKLHFRNKTVSFLISNENPGLLDSNSPDGEKLTGVILSRLGLNRRIFARDCQYSNVDKKSANVFLDKYHLLNSTGSAFNRGLYFRDELVAIASFSKGRKMRRLDDTERSFELIRFCCAHGISVSGGLSKLVKNFCREKKAGDIMSYVDTRLSDGSSFAKAGFEKEKTSEPEKQEKSHHKNSLKMIYSCKDQD